MKFSNISKPEQSPALKKILSIMRLAILLSILFSLQISVTVYSQETRLSLEVKKPNDKGSPFPY